MENWLSELLVVKINTNRILNKYAEIDAFSQGKLPNKKSNFSARNMGKNDVWIAATANVYNLRLLTTDLDFNHLHNEYIDLVTIDLADFK